MVRRFEGVAVALAEDGPRVEWRLGSAVDADADAPSAGGGGGRGEGLNDRFE